MSDLLPFSLGHTLSLKCISILWTVVDMTKFEVQVCKNIYNYKWGNILLYWLKDGICVITLPTLYPQIPNYRSIIQAVLSVKFQNRPIDNTFLSKLIPCATIKNVKSIPGVNDIDSLHMKWCTLKNMRNWPFSPGHTLSHKTNKNDSRYDQN